MAEYLQVASTALNSTASIAGGISANNAAKAQAAQLNANARQVRAASQMAAGEERRQARLMQSRAQAVAGGGGSDVGVVNLMSDIAEGGEYRALASIYQGEQEARSLDHRAQLARYEGGQDQMAGFIKGSGSALTGGYEWFKKYGEPNFKKKD